MRAKASETKAMAVAARLAARQEPLPAGDGGAAGGDIFALQRCKGGVGSGAYAVEVGLGGTLEFVAT